MGLMINQERIHQLSVMS